MKGISGVIGGVVVIILLLLSVSITLAAMNYAYGVQQIEAKTIMSQLSQPHVAQISPDSVMASGRLVASYIIYPNGRIALLNETVSGIRSFQSYLDGNPWAIVVFSNGQWVNVTNLDSYGQFGDLGYESYLVPYYPHPIDFWNVTQLAYLLTNGIEYNSPLLLPVNVSFWYNGTTVSVVLNPSDPLVYGFGRILDVPVLSENGWLNFTAASINNAPIYFAVLIQNTTGTLEVIYVSFYGYLQGIIPSINTSQTYYQVSYNVSYGIYQYITNPESQLPYIYMRDIYMCAIPYSYEPPYVLNPNISYTFYNASNGSKPTLNGYIFTSPLMKVAIKFGQGQPAQMYLWIGYYNGSGISWYRVLLPGFDVSTGSEIGCTEPVYRYQVITGTSIYGGQSVWVYGPYLVGYSAVWLNVTNSTWPVNIYSEYLNETYNINIYNIYGEPLVPEPGSVIEVVPYWQDTQSGTVIFNVTYSI